jgi:hypothetical protein
MATRTIHIIYRDIIPTRNRDAIILVIHCRVGQQRIIASGKVKPVRVMACGQTVAASVGGIASGAVQDDVTNGQVGAVGDGEAVDGPVLDVEIFNDGAEGHFGDGEHVVGSMEC